MGFRSFLQSLLPFRRHRRTLRIELYTRAGCHLCEEVEAQLRTAQSWYSLEVHVVDVDREDALRARYGDWVPVVVVEGKERFRGRVNAVLLDRLLRKESSRR